MSDGKRSLIVANAVTPAMALAFQWPLSALPWPYRNRSVVIGYFGFATARRLDAAGVQIGIGIGPVVNGYRYRPDACIQHLRDFQALGHTASGAPVRATEVNAEIPGMSGRPGPIEVGKAPTSSSPGEDAARRERLGPLHGAVRAGVKCPDIFRYSATSTGSRAAP